MHQLHRILAALLLLLALPGRVWAGGIPVDLELVLAVDVSGSIDPEEAQLQRRGYVEAFLNPKVINAIRSGPYGRIAVTYVEWAGDHYQQTMMGWTLLDGRDSITGFADRLAETGIGRERWTSISAGLTYSGALFETSPFEGTRRVIDVSGDGPNNSGPPLSLAREGVLARGITINGLPIVNNRPNPWGGEPPRDLDQYYRENVIGGPGAFIVVADGFDAFAQAILTKLLLEIAGTPPPTEHATCPNCAELP
ncbi:MAG TPA: DUF1194 domain-containing protein [Azospirillum sp.]|nr:DUF1194 domain-containing protein [Azospirillum sp.]